jgi:CRP-like cAMP-binding protein
VRTKSLAKNRNRTESCNIQEYLSNAGVSRRITKFKRKQVIFSQDDPCDDVLYIQSENAKPTIVNPQGKEAVPFPCVLTALALEDKY